MLFCAFFWYCVLADHRELLCVSVHCCSHCVVPVVLRRASKLSCDHAWSRFSGVSYGTLTHSSHCVERWETKGCHEIILFYQMCESCTCNGPYIAVRCIQLF